MHILEELLHYEILVRLPVKSLLRLKSVCKSWLSLIQSRRFIDIYNRRHRRDYRDHMVLSPYSSNPQLPTRLLSCSPMTNVINLDVSKQLDVVLPPVVLPPDITRLPEISGQYHRRNLELMQRVLVIVLGPTCNGIYCLVAQLHHSSESEPAKIALYNPATRECKLTAPLPPKSTFLAQYGFGVVKHDYKVVVVMIDRHKFLSFVYSLNRGTWEKTPVDVPANHIKKIDNGFEVCPQGFLNGSWHWMAVRLGDTSQYVVLSFDMEEEVFNLISGPPYYSRYMGDDHGLYAVKGGVSVLNDHLAAIYFKQGKKVPARFSSRSVIDVWMMMEYGVEDSWTQIYTVNTDCNFIVESLVGVSSSERDEGGIHIQRIFFQDTDGRLVSCDDVGAKMHGDCDICHSIFWNNLGISSYSETLEPLQIEDNGEEEQIEDNSSVSVGGLQMFCKRLDECLDV